MDGTHECVSPPHRHWIMGITKREAISGSNFDVPHTPTKKAVLILLKTICENAHFNHCLLMPRTKLPETKLIVKSSRKL